MRQTTRPPEPTGRPAAGPSRDGFDGRGLRAVFQPVIDLASDHVVGYEALARSAVQAPPLEPSVLLAAAREAGRLVELDWTCRSLALCAAVRAGLRPPTLLFVNAEPESLASPCPAELLPEVADAHRRLDVVVEVTERHLLHRPDQLLRAVEAVRGLGWQIALDDVGVTDAGLALLPVLRPDVVKLDRSMLRTTDAADRARTMAAVRVYAADTGARVVAEGIETPADRERAVELGAGWGQGFLLGRPGAIEPGRQAARGAPVRAGRPAGDRSDWDGSAFSLLAASPSPPPADALDVDEQVRLLCAQAERAPRSAVLLVAVPAGARLGSATWAQLARLHDLCALVSVLSAGRPPRRLPWVRVTRVQPGDPLAQEFCGVLLSPAAALAVAARRVGDGWESVRSASPAVVSRLARLLVARTGAASYDLWD
jgi:EAL domain-containing protein (putative c-di-GMP-specific phosphodiesterase class I)